MIRDCIRCLQGVFQYLWVVLLPIFLDIKMKTVFTHANIIKLFLYLPTELFWLWLWSKQLNHPSSVGSLMCQDPEISFVFIRLPFKRKQFAYYLRSEQLLTVLFCFVHLNSLYFLVTHADVLVSFLLSAWTYFLILKRFYYTEIDVENNLRLWLKESFFPFI